MNMATALPLLVQHEDPYRLMRRCALFLAVLISGGLLMFPRLPLLLAMVVVGLLGAGMHWVRLRRTVWLWGLVCVILLAALVRPGGLDPESLAIRYANFLGAVVLLNAYLMADDQALQRDLFVILPWMAIQAIVTFTLANAAPFLFTSLQFGDVSFQTILLIFNYHDLLENSSLLQRPDGFFYEPGVFQIYLNLYLYLALFVFRSNKHIFLALAAVVSTLSTTGILICLMLLIAAFSDRILVGKLRHKLAAIALVVVLGPPVGVVAYNNIQAKLIGEAQGSSWARQYDFFTGINVISQYPILGIGFDHSRYLSLSINSAYVESQLSEQGMEDRASSNGLIYLYYTLGIPLASIFVWAMFCQRFFTHRILIGMLLSMSLFGESIVFTPFILMIVFSAFVSRHRNSVRSVAGPRQELTA